MVSRSAKGGYDYENHALLWLRRMELRGGAAAEVDHHVLYIYNVVNVGILPDLRFTGKFTGK